MKQTLLVTGLLALFFISSGQVKRKEIGFEGGINFSAPNNKIPKTMLAGLSIGGNFTTNTSDHFGLKVVLQYEQNAWAYRSLRFANNSGTGLAKGELNYKLT